MVSHKDKKSTWCVRNRKKVREGGMKEKKIPWNLVKTSLSTKLLSSTLKVLRDSQLTSNLPLCRFLHNQKLQPAGKIFSKQRMAERVWIVLVYKLEEEGFFHSEKQVLPLSSVFLPIFSSFGLKQLQVLKSVPISLWVNASCTLHCFRFWFCWACFIN